MSVDDPHHGSKLGKLLILLGFLGLIFSLIPIIRGQYTSAIGLSIVSIILTFAGWRVVRSERPRTIRNIKSQYPGWDYPNREIEVPAPSLDDYLINVDREITSQDMFFDGSDMSEIYIEEFLTPRTSLFNEIAESHSEVDSIATDNNHPIRILAARQSDKSVSFFTKRAQGLTVWESEKIAAAGASIATTIVDGFIAALAEKEFFGSPEYGKQGGLLMSQVSKDFLITTTVRNYTGTTGTDIAALLGQPLMGLNMHTPPPFGPSPADNIWNFIRYLMDYGFYCGSFYLLMGRPAFEKKWAIC